MTIQTIIVIRAIMSPKKQMIASHKLIIQNKLVNQVTENIPIYFLDLRLSRRQR